MNVNLVILVELKLLFCTVVGFQGDFKAVSGFNRLQLVIFCFVNRLKQIEPISLSSFLSKTSLSVQSN